MRPLIHLYFAFLLPVSLVIALFFIFYFTIEYNITQSITLGILYGLFTGVFVTFIVVIAIVLLRKSQNNFLAKFKITEKENKIDEKAEETEQESSPDPKIKEKEHVQEEMGPRLMLLMNKELTFGIILTIIKKQITHSITKHNIDKGSINIKINGEIISISITALTKHTTQVKINGINNEKHIQSIVSFLKEKEHSFLQY